MSDKILKTLEAERNRLWAEARLKGLPQGSPVRERIAELDQSIREHREAAAAPQKPPTS